MMAATTADQGVLVYGAGSASCATAWEDQHSRETSEWVLGFWSGRNWDHDGRTGVTSDRAGVVAEVKLICAQEPSKALVAATFRAYDKMRKENR